jgi:precorrin-6B methylase 1
MKMLYVRWRDSMRETGWRSVDDARTELRKSLDAETVGFLVAENKHQIVLALNHQKIAGHEVMVGETITIPKEAIVRRRALEAMKDG